MKIKVSEATNLQLDWLVAKATNTIVIQVRKGVTFTPSYPTIGGKPFQPSTDWLTGGPLIEREKITVSDALNSWCAGYNGTLNTFGPTPLIAAMRCYVASKFGDEVEVPDELH